MAKPAEVRESFEEAYEQFLEPMFRYFSYRLDDRDRARELAQETFMRAWKHLAGGKEIESFKPFLYTTAGNLFKNELRDRRPASSLETLMETRGFDAEDERVTGADEAADARLLFGKLDELPERDREVLVLRYADGLDNREIAHMLGISESATGVRIHRAIARLRAVYHGTK